jgi:hypothetical protein
MLNEWVSGKFFSSANSRLKRERLWVEIDFFMVLTVYLVSMINM